VAALDRLSGADVFDLGALRPVVEAADPEGRLAPIGLRELRIGTGLLEELPEVLERLGVQGRVLVAGDATSIRDAGGRDVKAAALEVVGARFEVAPASLGADLHADEATIASATEALAGAAGVVCVGSGTAADVCKAATAEADPRPALVLLQTADSVNGYADDVSVLLKSGVKRTTPTRWADALLLDLDVLAGAPPAMTAAGFGDSIATWTAAPDWRLAGLVGMDAGWHPVPFALAGPPARALIDVADGLQSHAPETLEVVARSLTASGLAIGLTGTTACLSGGEHLVSHLLDMEAGARHGPTALHGAQVGLATVLMAIVWDDLLGRETLPVGVPDEAAVRAAVDAAFAPLDPDGSMRAECWGDCSRKLARWRSVQDQVAEVAADWPAHREQLRALTLPAEDIARAMREAGAPIRFADLDPPVTAEAGRWALGHCHLMRDRFTAVDLLAFAGEWGDDAVDDVLERARELGAGL
jgi:glycerol-1-phosphate dehydrogenase [NAD(P)+]